MRTRARSVVIVVIAAISVAAEASFESIVLRLNAVYEHADHAGRYLVVEGAHGGRLRRKAPPRHQQLASLRVDASHLDRSQRRGTSLSEEARCDIREPSFLARR